MEDQDDREPLDATAEAGAALIEMIVVNVSNFVNAMIEGDEVAEIPPFFP